MVEMEGGEAMAGEVEEAEEMEEVEINMHTISKLCHRLEWTNCGTITQNRLLIPTMDKVLKTMEYNSKL